MRKINISYYPNGYNKPFFLCQNFTKTTILLDGKCNEYSKVLYSYDPEYFINKNQQKALWHKADIIVSSNKNIFEFFGPPPTAIKVINQGDNNILHLTILQN